MVAASQRLYRGLRERERKRLQRVCAFARTHLHALKRRSGESYALHGLEVATTLREGFDDPVLLSVAVLHDLLVHPEGVALLRSSPLSEEECQLVQRMYELRRLHIDESTRDLDTVIEAFTGDPRLLPLRMAHRVNDVRHLNRFSRLLQKQIAKEALHMYATIAGRLGLQVWRNEMEDTCFVIVQPIIARKVARQFEQCRTLDMLCLQHSSNFLQRKLKAQGIPCRIEKRLKGKFSSYRKMIMKHRRFDELTDRLALRIIVPQSMDCYRTLAVVHSFMHPIPGKLKDYIGAPKENGYKSIHTVVYPLPGVTEQPIEIQIRSEEMHRLSEFGMAAHGEYKNASYALNTKPARVNLFRNFESLRDEARSPRQFEQALRKYFREDHIALFDSDNNLYHLKQPATALDFVCHAFPKRCGNLKETRVNGRHRPFDTLLNDGDIIEPRFARERCIKKDWVQSCKHASTRSCVRGLCEAR